MCSVSSPFLNLVSLLSFPRFRLLFRNPVDTLPGDGSDVGFEATDPDADQITRQHFSGLWRNHQSNVTFLQGYPSDDGWFMAVGAHVAFNGGIPSVPNPPTTVNFVQLYVDAGKSGERFFKEKYEAQEKQIELENVWGMRPVFMHGL